MVATAYHRLPYLPDPNQLEMPLLALSAPCSALVHSSYNLDMHKHTSLTFLSKASTALFSSAPVLVIDWSMFFSAFALYSSSFWSTLWVPSRAWAASLSNSLPASAARTSASLRTSVPLVGASFFAAC